MKFRKLRSSGRFKLVLMVSLLVLLSVPVALFSDLFGYLNLARSPHSYNGKANDLSNRVQPDSYYDDPWVYFIGDGFVKSQQSDPSDSWPTIVGKDRGWYVRNFGSRGAGYATRGYDGREYSDIARSAGLADADGVVVAGGMSDALSPAPLDVIERGINGTFLAIRQSSLEVPITVLPVVLPAGTPSDRVSEINSILRRVSPKYGALFVSDVSLPTDFTVAEGSANIAYSVNEQIARAVSGRVLPPAER